MDSNYFGKLYCNNCTQQNKCNVQLKEEKADICNAVRRTLFCSTQFSIENTSCINVYSDFPNNISENYILKVIRYYISAYLATLMLS